MTLVHLISSYYIVPPKISHFDFGEEPANSGDLASVTCLVPSGDLPIELNWFFNSRPLLSYEGISTSKIGKRTSLLTIDSVNGNHAGNYTCVAKNQADNVNFTASLIVNGIYFYRVFRIIYYLKIERLYFYFCPNSPYSVQLYALKKPLFSLPVNCGHGD